MIHSVLTVIHVSYSRFYKCQISSLYFIQIIIIRNIVIFISPQERLSNILCILSLVSLCSYYFYSLLAFIENYSIEAGFYLIM